MILLLALIGALSNYGLRGGGIDTAFLNGRNVPGLKYVNALLFGGVGWLLCGRWQVAMGLSLGMFLGAMFGLKDYIGALIGDSQKSVAWGIARLTLRGAVWGGLIAIGSSVGLIWFPWHCLIWFWALSITAGALQGIITYGCWLQLKDKWTPVINFWTVSEMIHGAVLWMALAAL